MLEIDVFGLASHLPLWDWSLLISSFPSANQKFCVEMVW